MTDFDPCTQKQEHQKSTRHAEAECPERTEYFSWFNPHGGETMPVWRTPYTPIEDGEQPHEMCEIGEGDGDDACTGTDWLTGIHGDAWIILCDTHFEGTPVTKDEYDALAEAMS